MKNITLTLLAILLIPVMAFAQNASKKVTWLNVPAVAFGSVTASYTTFATLTSPITVFDIVNLTDAGIFCTDVTGVDKWPIPAYSAFSPQLGQNFRYMNGVIFCKRLTAAAPTVGNVHFNAGY
jgi:hypothetical protein